MRASFSFCGIDIETLGLEYAPELEDTYVYKAAKPKIHDEVFDGHNGGYYYGMSKEPKEFILRCFFEQKEIDRGVMAKIMDLFREGRKGKLVFTRRSWSYYNAVVTDLDLTGITNYLNGVIKITMKAYYPFSRSDMIVADYKHPDYDNLYSTSVYEPHKKDYLKGPSYIPVYYSKYGLFDYEYINPLEIFLSYIKDTKYINL
jgi:hypothetical protein